MSFRRADEEANELLFSGLQHTGEFLDVDIVTPSVEKWLGEFVAMGVGSGGETELRFLAIIELGIVIAKVQPIGEWRACLTTVGSGARLGP